ncbi:histidinol-phosphatase [Piedraia hortae CBS 480.64]|uniref:Histidinol-phosphatase n=1 Tax=Piedraia hortae CBS 480.64 TaxID=1314780 RepID=A0A6A7C0L6_9PEZI|nr:histidinol-phosphatase [Piedraia hortae CBS 480.64]
MDSHHSHSGQFCHHAVSTLEEVVQRAISLKMKTFCMTEHMPREERDFYPEEKGADLELLFDQYYHEARRLQEKYADEIDLFVGFEGEWIRDSTLDRIQQLQAKYAFDLFVGSVHHVHTIPIDYDAETYNAAREGSGGSDSQLFCDYFDAQYSMLQALKPPLVGHFDLIRLKSDQPDEPLHSLPSVWPKAERNLRYIAAYGGVVEINSAALRKGLKEAYPQNVVCSFFKSIGGRFALSDDSHGVEHVASNYNQIQKMLAEIGITPDHLVRLAPNSTWMKRNL